jgi:hypothetical protein
LPPALVEVDPQPGVGLAATQPVTLYFNQPMQRASVESALRLDPPIAGSLSWPDDSTLVFQPAQPVEPGSTLAIQLDTAARSANGLALPAPVSLQLQAAGALELAQRLPEPGAAEVDANVAVVAAFNRPVVALGADAAGLPVAFQLEPAATGRGEWLNTSTYIFYPQPGLQGGLTYTVILNPELRSVDGSPLSAGESWTFTTALPQLLSVEPLPGALGLRLDSAITLTFNMPMDPDSLLAGFRLVDQAGQPVPGEQSWNETFTRLRFTPAQLLARGAVYRLVLDQQATAAGGTPLVAGYNDTYRSVPDLAVVSSQPTPGGTSFPYNALMISFSGPIINRKLEQYVDLQPTVADMSLWWDETARQLIVYGSFAPSTDYILTISPNLSDPWGSALGQPYRLPFRTEPLPPQLNVSTGTDVLFLTSADAAVQAQATNLPFASLASGSLDLNDFILMISSDNPYEQRRFYHSFDEVAWQQTFDLASDRAQFVELPVNPQRRPLLPGLYYLRADIPAENSLVGPYLLVVSDVHLVFKLGPTNVLVWAAEVGSAAPLAGAPIRILNASGELLAQGFTGPDGVFQSEIAPLPDTFATYYAVLGQPGDESFSLALSTWSFGVSSWDFNLPTDFTGPRLSAYLYTDRPIYRPGQTVYFRGVVRQAFNGRYQLPDIESLPLTLYKDYSTEVARLELPLSSFGTVHGEYQLSPDAQPGYYRLASELDEYRITLNFQVAEYRKPEINLQVDFEQTQVLAGETLAGVIEARYFFDASVGGLPVRWSLYAAPDFYNLPGYQVGVEDTRWLDAFYYPVFFDPLGGLVSQGEASADAQGRLRLELPTQAAQGLQRYTLEVTAQDESGQPVSARAVASVHPSEINIGLRPDAWVGQAGEPIGFDVQVVDLQQNPAGVRSLRAEFNRVVWTRQDAPSGDPFGLPRYTPAYTLAGSADFQTNAQGQARLAFTPPDPGTYQLRVSGAGAVTEMTVWVGGPGQAIWPNLPFQRLRLTADRSAYLPGDVAQIFVPNPIGAPVQALLTVERSSVLRYRTLALEPGGSAIELPLGVEDAPNVFVSVTLLGRSQEGLLELRQGYLELPVEPQEQVLNVSLASQPQRAGPGENVTFELLVTDAAGQPMQGEFSLAVVDRAVLALADPNAPDIRQAFYGNQPLGVRTGLALTAYARLRTLNPGGVGGGGGGGDGAAPLVRERFPDTAAWFAEIVTGPDGRAQVSLALPDSLTTWQVLVRGVTTATQVGQAELDLVTSKDLIIRPVTPRFLVAGDRVELAAVAQNNTAASLAVEVSLQASGASLDDPASASQRVELPPGGRARAAWWVTVQDGELADLLFSARAEAGGVLYHDAARPAAGRLPILRYNAPQSFVTAGILDEAGERLELVSLPRSFDASGGGLELEMTSSLAGVVLGGLQALENYPYDSAERLVSRLLPNLAAAQALGQLGLDAPELQANLERELRDGLQRLLARQNPDGGWTWWSGEISDPFISAYALLALSRAQQAGSGVPEQALQSAINYLYATLYTPEMGQAAWQLDRLALAHYALAQAGQGDLSGAQALFEARGRLSPWASGLLALALEQLSPGSQAARTLISDLAASAIRSASGAHWEAAEPGWQNMTTSLANSAIALYALALRDPASPLVADAVRYLVAHRLADRAWESTYTSSWSLLAFTQVMLATGELGANFSFQAVLNGNVLASGQASASGALVTANTPLAALYPDAPNALLLQRSQGAGRLFYTAALRVNRPVETIPPVQRGLSLSRVYYPAGVDCLRQDCQPVDTAQAGQRVAARLTLTLEHDAYYLKVEDYLPAGAELLDASLKTTQQGSGLEQPPGESPALPFDVRSPFGDGWGWWLFNPPLLYDDHIAWAADYLPAGVYELTYTIVALQPGEYRLLPARAWLSYFPDVQGASAGMVFMIR